MLAFLDLSSGMVFSVLEWYLALVYYRLLWLHHFSILTLPFNLFGVSGISLWLKTGNETSIPSDALGASLDPFSAIFSSLTCSPMITLNK